MILSRSFDSGLKESPLFLSKLKLGLFPGANNLTWNNRHKLCDQLGLKFSSSKLSLLISAAVSLSLSNKKQQFTAIRNILRFTID